MSLAFKNGTETAEVYAGGGSDRTLAGSSCIITDIERGSSSAGVAGEVGGVWNGAILDCRSSETDLFLLSAIVTGDRTSGLEDVAGVWGSFGGGPFARFFPLPIGAS